MWEGMECSFLGSFFLQCLKCPGHLEARGHLLLLCVAPSSPQVEYDVVRTVPQMTRLELGLLRASLTLLSKRWALGSQAAINSHSVRASRPSVRPSCLE